AGISDDRSAAGISAEANRRHARTNEGAFRRSDTGRSKGRIGGEKELVKIEAVFTHPEVDRVRPSVGYDNEGPGVTVNISHPVPSCSGERGSTGDLYCARW